MTVERARVWAGALCVTLWVGATEARAQAMAPVDRLGNEARATAATCPGVPFASSYAVTNRSKPFADTRAEIVPAPPGDLSFYTAAGAYQSSLVRLRYRATTPQSLMLAADISAVSLQTGQQGQAIADICQDVSVYYSGADPDMTVSNYQFAKFHLKDFPTRLGGIGPYYYSNPAPLNPNVTGVDSSKVTLNLPGGIVSVHDSYRSLPPALLDMTQTMLGVQPTNRCPIAGTTQGFTLESAPIITCP